MSLRHPEKWPPELLGALDPVMVLLEDDTVTEIEANAFNEIYAKGRVSRTGREGIPRKYRSSKQNLTDTEHQTRFIQPR